MAAHLMTMMAEGGIRDFEREGGFKRLSLEGKSLSDDSFGALLEDQRMDARALKSCGGEPTEIALIKEIQAMRQGWPCAPMPGAPLSYTSISQGSPSS